MPRTENQKAVTAYLALELYDQLKDFRLDEGLKSDSQAIAVVLERFFAHCLSLPVDIKPSANNPIEERLEQLEKKIASMQYHWKDQRDHMLEILDDLLARTEFLIPESVRSDVQSDVPSTASSSVPSTVESTVESDVLSKVESDVLSTANGSVPSTVESTVESDVLSKVESDVLSTANGSVPSTVESTVESDVLSTANGSVPSTVESTVESDVPSNVPSTANGSVLSTVESDVPSTANGSVPSTVENTVDSSRLYVVCRLNTEGDPTAFDYWGSSKLGFTIRLQSATKYKSLKIASKAAQKIRDSDVSYADGNTAGWQIKINTLEFFEQKQAEKAEAIA